MTSTNASPRRTITLPFDVKSRIVGYAKEQDERHHALTKSWQGMTTGLQDISVDWYGRSVNALFLVDREYSELAAAHLFKTLDVRRADCLDFQIGILPKHGHNFRKLFFRAKSHDSADDVLQRLGYGLSLLSTSLSHVKELSFTGKALEGLFGDTSSYSRARGKMDRGHLIRSILAAASQSVSRVSVEDASVAMAGRLFALLRTLRTVRIRGSKMLEYPSDRTALHGQLATFDRLEGLDVDVTGGHSFSFCEDLSYPLAWKAATTLKVLRLRIDQLSDDEVNFVRAFSGTLQSLEINLRVGYELFPITPNVTNSFPSLTTLLLTGCLPDLTTLLSSLTAAPLQHVTLICETKDLSTDLPLLLTALKRHKRTLLFFFISRYDVFGGALDSTSSARVAACCKKWGVALSREGLFTPCGASRPKGVAQVPRTDAGRVEEVNRTCLAVNEVLRGGLRSSEQIRLAGDLAGSRELAALAKGLWSKQAYDRV